jgi:hypothetical protein
MLGVDLKLELPVKQIWTALALNVLTQAVCVTGVNRLTSRVSSLTTTLILTLRKALSLFLSIYFYQAGQAGLGIWLGGFLVLGELPSLALHYATVRQRLMPRLLIDSRDGRLLGRIEPSAVRPKERYQTAGAGGQERSLSATRLFNPTHPLSTLGAFSGREPLPCHGRRCTGGRARAQLVSRSSAASSNFPRGRARPSFELLLLLPYLPSASLPPLPPLSSCTRG